MTTMTATRRISPFIAGIDRTLELVEQQIKALKVESAPQNGAVRGDAGADTYRLDDLEVFAQRLQQIRAWLQQDDNLLKVVDDHISQQAQQIDRVRARRDVRLAVVTTVIGAILGWLLSVAATPMQLFHTLFH